jgi:hypothetical protein
MAGYVEWHLANTFRSIAVANGMSALDIIVLRGVTVSVLATTHQHTDGRVNILDTLVKLFTLVVANTAAQAVVRIVTLQSSFDIFSALFIMTIMLQALLAYYQRLLV